jgi:hypothetical protein
MTVEQLIEMLKGAHPKDIVEIFEVETVDWEPITGMTYGGNDHKVRLYTDEP